MNKLLARLMSYLAITCCLLVTGVAARASDFPTPVEGDWTVQDFHFHGGEVLPAFRIHYRTIGSPSGEPVIVLHGTTQSGASMLGPDFGGELFGPGQPLDASRYYIILPDAIGHGKSSKPSDGLRMGFPHYDYNDMVEASYRLVTEHLGIPRVRLVIGYSMGGMETWIFAERHPQFMDIAVPLASLPSAMSGRNWMLRRLIIDSIRKDPEWDNGNYTKQPASTHFASVFFGMATLGGNQGLQKLAPTREKADEIVDKRLNTPSTADANDVLYQWESSADYDPSADLEHIQARVLAINSADDERNPPELGILDREIKRVKNGHFYIIPADENTSGHRTASLARYWGKHLAELLQSTPKGGK